MFLAGQHGKLGGIRHDKKPANHKPPAKIANARFATPDIEVRRWTEIWELKGASHPLIGQVEVSSRLNKICRT